MLAFRHNLTAKAALSSMGSESRAYLQLQPYSPPKWAEALKKIPKQRFSLATLPTPVHRWTLPGAEEFELWIKRDDLSGMQLSGNKVRKLEFIIAAAKAQGHDCVITIGGIQSNHCRATAVAARYAGLDCHLILRNSRALADEDPGLVGNLLVERLVGAHVHQVTKEEYVQHGSMALAETLATQLRAKGLNPCIIPVGGSSALGTWGYIEAFREMQQQAPDSRGFTDIVMACGSGGTTAGIALANYLSGHKARVWAFGVCDDPEYFYSFIQGLLDELGAGSNKIGATARDLVTCVQAKGGGYAISSSAELQFMQHIAQSSGIILDPVYSGKAAKGLLEAMSSNPADWSGRRIVFLHTGGLLGMYDKLPQLQPIVGGLGRSHRLQLDAS
ncbi:hypothetical protein WJX73_003347 [Symbiochloris irregularis]|uniref:Tryptophan synthase beta chain-like PALP domain-containing protein n=1 Tax=Symbiochloris irregularis TaxID=706552 RepID=A0AAW1NT23_9CHLO